MRRREVLKAFKANGVTFKREGKGDHDVWVCGCDEQHEAVLTETRDISPGVVRDTIRRLACLPKGWLQ